MIRTKMKEKAEKIIIVEAEGEARDIHSVLKLREELKKLLKPPTRGVILDISGIKHPCSLFISILASYSLGKDESKLARLVLVNLPSEVHHILHILGLKSVFRIYADIETALERAEEWIRIP